MILRCGNLFESMDDVILVTTNSYINKLGALVMGRGAALEMKTIYPGIEKYFGKKVLENFSLPPTATGQMGRYGVVLKENNVGPQDYLGIFQVKYNFRDEADLGLIEYSTEKLKFLIDDGFINLDISMNFPGIGFGQLSARKVLPIIEKLPDNVMVYVRHWSDLYE